MADSWLFDVKHIIEIDPEKLSGTPVFPGTRVPIQNLFDCLEAGESLAEFLDQFPTVTPEQALSVLEASKEKLLASYALAQTRFFRPRSANR